MQQKGSLKGRFIFEHLWDAFGSWSAIDSGAFFFVDFSKAFNSVSHAFTCAFFELLHVPSEYVNILLMLLKAPIALIIRGGVHLSTLIHRTSGVRQGCPLPPTIFAMLISPMVTKLQTLFVDVNVLLYVDDLIIIFGSPQKTASLLHECWAVMEQFQHITGLNVNPKKSAILTLGIWTVAALRDLASVPLPVQKCYKYLGVKLGNVSPSEAYNIALQKALGTMPC